MEEAACNYDLSATVSGGCEYAETNYDCSGNCIVDFDCDGICGGSLIDDVCGVCDGDSSSCTGCMEEAACNYDLSATVSGGCEYAETNYDCSGNCNVEVDCNGTCGGSLIDDECGVCEGDGSSCLGEVPGCMDSEACNYNSEATFDNGSCEENDCAGVCGGSSVVDCDGVCDGSAEGLGCGCREAAPSGCDNVCNSTVAADCDGVCGGGLIDDACGVCDGDNSSCTGCMDEVACNHDSTATVSGECEYSATNYDCSGNCTVTVDCNGICGGSLIDDACGVCDGDSLSCTGCMDDIACNYSSTATISSGGCEYAETNYDCSGNCIVTVDCNGTCGGSLIDDACGVCGGDNSSCTDCNGVINGGAINNLCGCVGGSTELEENFCFGCRDEAAVNTCENCTEYCDEDPLSYYCCVYALSAELVSLPTEYEIVNNYPNPFNPETTINYSIPQTAWVSLSIYNLKGEFVSTIIDEVENPGNYSVTWNGNNFINRQMPTGIYFAILRSNEILVSHKLLLMK